MAIITKHSETTGVVPTAAQLELGELAINTADSKLFAENTSGQVIELSYRDARVKDYLSGGTYNANIIPATNNTYDLGSSTKMWRDVYIGPGSLYVNGQKVIQEETITGDIVITADADQNIRLSTLGSGDIQFDPIGTGSIIVKGPLQVQAGNNISSSDGNAINFSNQIAVDSLTSKTTNADLNLTGNGTGGVRVDDNLIVTGNLTISGTTTTVNTETISLADNIIDLNSNFTTGTPSENSGIRIMRGDSAAVQLRWNETTDKWEFTNDGATYVDIPTSSGASLTSFSVTDSGGDGSLSYNNTTGVFTYTGPSSTEVRSHFTAGTGITITNGSIATTITQYTDALARAAVSSTTGSAAYNSSTGVITIPGTSSHITEGTNLFYTDARARAAISAGTGISYNSTTGVISTTGGGSGTVTSVGLTAGAGISVSGGPITSSGSITVTNTGVTSVTASTGLSASSSTGGITLTNTGVTSLIAGSGVTLSSSTGSITISATGGGGSVATYLETEILVVGGGGGGGAGGAPSSGNIPPTGVNYCGGGGGGGGVITAILPFEVGRPYAIQVGNGGAAGTQFAAAPSGNIQSKGANGQDSMLDVYVAKGGGGGGGCYYGTLDGNSGGSGGGAGSSGQANYPSAPNQGRGGTSNQVYACAIGIGNDGVSGLWQVNGAPSIGGTGGGGAGGVITGFDRYYGGPGISVPISGTATRYGGGGGGGPTPVPSTTTTFRNPQSPGGWCSMSTPTYGLAQPATANTGGGGGGSLVLTSGGAGATGIIIIKIPDTRTATFSSELTTSLSTAVAGFKIYSITAGKGTVTFS